nr:MAG TPA: hypothetical protein [Caudoviricetes sp.]
MLLLQFDQPLTDVHKTTSLPVYILSPRLVMPLEQMGGSSIASYGDIYT